MKSGKRKLGIDNRFSICYYKYGKGETKNENQSYSKGIIRTEKQ